MSRFSEYDDVQKMLFSRERFVVEVSVELVSLFDPCFQMKMYHKFRTLVPIYTK